MNDELYEKALDAIQELFGDDSVSQSRARKNLGALKDEIDVMIETLDADDADD